MYWNLFLSFFKIGLVSFGGGYAMLPLIEYEVKSNNWLTTKQLTDAIAIAGMSPGPIATNSAVFVGYHVGGILGAIVSTIAISLPSLIIVVLIALFVSRMKSDHSIMNHVFYGLRPVITALIVYAAINFAIQNNIINGLSLAAVDWISILFVCMALALLLFTRLSPVFIIFLAGVAGIIVYY